MLASFHAFAFKRQINISPTVTAITVLLSAFGLDVGDSLPNLANRTKLFAATGLSGRSIELSIENCARQAVLSRTAGFPDRGLFDRNISIGVCDVRPNYVSTATVVLPASDNRTISSDIFFHDNSGFGVISDIDDTIKVTNVLNPATLLKTTFLDDPVPVPGMPRLYKSLAQAFSSDFIYVSGSMLQIYPFLHDFIHSTYAASRGPLFLRNLTDISDIVNFIQSDGIYEYKSTIIDQINGMYPNKKFLVIGDSTQKDPETYGEA
ncbi:hypothetical protein AX15_007061 [Amanita polypyramis BW_CC]|nr:hypothetical protein AX15_007061 [Amanita polypyramis BW_CC]